MFVYSHASSQLWGLGRTSSALRTPYEPSPLPPPPSDQHSRWVHSVWSRRTDMTWTCTTDTHVTLRLHVTRFVPGLIPDVHAVKVFKILNRNLNDAQICGFIICYLWCNILYYCMNLLCCFSFFSNSIKCKSYISACSFLTLHYIVVLFSNVHAHSFFLPLIYQLIIYCAFIVQEINKHKDKQEEIKVNSPRFLIFWAFWTVFLHQVPEREGSRHRG